MRIFFFSFVLMISIVPPLQLSAQKITIRDNVQYVKNEPYRGNHPKKITLKFTREYGGLEKSSDGVMLYRPCDAVVSQDHFLYILDRKGPNIKIYGPDGMYVGTIGRLGQGPGEFLDPVGIDVSPEGNLYVSDSKQYGITIIDSAGVYTGKVYPPVTGRFPVFRVMNSGDLVCGLNSILSYVPVGGIFEEPVLTLFSASGKLLHQFGALKKYHDQTLKKAMNAVHYAIGENDTIYVAFQYQNRIEKYTPDGRLVMQATRKLSYRESKNPEVVTTKKGGFGVALPRINRVSSGMHVDGNGRVWVLTFTRQPYTKLYLPNDPVTKEWWVIKETETDFLKLEVFNPDGRLVSELPVQEYFYPEIDCLYIKNNRLFLIDQSRALVKEYAIIG